jgi:hypothetical protein
MKRKRFSVEQIVAVLKQAELGMAVADVIRQVGPRAVCVCSHPYASGQVSHNP